MNALPVLASPIVPDLRDVPGLRLVSAPTSAPPYDDELPAGTPVLRLVPPLRSPSSRPSSDNEPAPPSDVDRWLAAARTPCAVLPESRAFAYALVQGVLEVLAGVRPVKQLQRDTSAELYARLSATLGTHPRGTGLRPDGRSVRSLHVQERPEGIAEVCATVVRGQRSTAFALRLEGLDGRWRCTDLVGI